LKATTAQMLFHAHVRWSSSDSNTNRASTKGIRATA